MMKKLKEITKEMVYLCIGDDLKKIENTKIQIVYFQGIKYFEINEYRIIEGNEILFCSCNEKYCWHIFKVVLEKKCEL